MRKLKIYLETTMFNYYFDAERDAHPATVQLFDEIKQGMWNAYTSDYVLAELNDAPEPKRTKMLELAERIKALSASDETVAFMRVLIGYGAVPKNSVDDGLHIACAIVNNCDMIISLNFAHIVRHTTIERAELAAIHNGYKSIKIYSPMEVIENEQ